jgi:heme/copper-type cytochrome/quinol oxidase subunit 3
MDDIIALLSTLAFGFVFSAILLYIDAVQTEREKRQAEQKLYADGFYTEVAQHLIEYAESLCEPKP